MSTFNFVIRDGLDEDIETCLALDHQYATDYVWQMTFQQEAHNWRANFRTEKLPREVTHSYRYSEQRLQFALEHQGFLVAVGRDEPTLLGYLTIQHNPFNQVCYLHDLVVSQPFRRKGVGSRMMMVAKRWAHEKHAHAFIAETQTQNHPAIVFCQRHGLTFCGFNDKQSVTHEIAIFFGQTL
jgi:GNAT superfamily N-acetyltransferase